MIKIDENNCTDCAICYEVCPGYVFHLNKNNKPKVTVRFSDLCCSCGHCVSICPADALTHENLLQDDFIEIEKPGIESSDMQKLILSRRSIRKYKDKQIPDEIINLLIECGSHAGSASNIQSESFVVIKDKNFLKKLEPIIIDSLWEGGIKYFKGKGLINKILTKKFGAEMAKQYGKYHKLIKRIKENNETEGRIFRNAPTVFFIHGHRENYLSQTNSALALRNIELMAQTLGLGTCHVGFFVSAADMKTNIINKSIGLDDSRKIYGALMIGYPKYEYKKRIPRKNRAVSYGEVV